jgi:hypothetical protein
MHETTQVVCCIRLENHTLPCSCGLHLSGKCTPGKYPNPGKCTIHNVCKYFVYTPRVKV